MSGSLSAAVADVHAMAARRERQPNPGTTNVVILGGQGVLLRLNVQGTDASPGGAGVTHFTTWVRLRNLLPQPLGTSDGVTADPRGIVVILPQAVGANPAAVGPGTVTATNADTSDMWTSPVDFGFKYPSLVPGGAVTDLKKWTFTLTGGATSFVTTVYVAAQLADESPGTLSAPAPPSTFASVDAPSGNLRTCAVRSSTSLVYCWGFDVFGASGSGTAPGRIAPSKPVDGAPLASVFLGGAHACGLTSAGIAHCWGEGRSGQVAGFNFSLFALPRNVIGELAFSTLALGAAHTCGIANAQLWCWGYNGFGQLGDGSTLARSAPTLIATPEPLVSLTAGQFYSCGLTAAGVAYCWGSNGNGQLGDGTTTQRPTPTAVTMPAGVTFASLSAGELHTCGVSTAASTPANTVFCWGRNPNGQLGDGTTTQRLTPTPVSGPTGFTKLAAARDHTCGLLGTSVYCWGSNSFGQIGDGTNTQRLTPTIIPGSFSDLAASVTLSCALDLSGNAMCWGDNSLGTAGDASLINRNAPNAIPGGFTFTSIVVGGLTACGIQSGVVRCWGDNRRGQFGDGSLHTALQPQAVVSGVQFTTTLALGSSHTCALSTAGLPYCWGGNGSRQTGDGSTSHFALLPVAVTGFSAVTFNSMTAGQVHTCALTTTGTPYCWGGNGEGQRGDGTTNTTNSATAVSGSPTYTAISAGWSHTCALDAAGNAFCWGRNAEGQLGRGDVVGPETAPVAVTMPAGVQFASIHAGQSHTCAITTESTPRSFCWGLNSSGQIGDGTFTNRTAPTLVAGTPTFVTLAAGGQNTCGLTAGGVAYCWGSNGSGQIGNNTFGASVPAPAAVLMPAGITFTSLTAGSNYECAIGTTGTLYCWGENFWGNLGNGTFFNQARPIPITLQ